MTTGRHKGVTRGLAVAAVAVLLAACGSGDSTTAEPAKPEAARSSHAGHGSTHTNPPSAPLRAGERFQTLTMPRAYTPDPPAAGGTDDYRCFLVDPGLTQRTILTGSQFLPQNPDIVHHAIFFRVAPADVAEAKQLDADAPGDGWTCFGGSGIQGKSRNAFASLNGAAWITSWAPGGGERFSPAGTGVVLEPGTQVVMQIHYNLLATAGQATGSDQSSLKLRVGSPDLKVQPLQTSLLVAPIELPCPPGESGPLCDRATSTIDSIRRYGESSGRTIAGLNLLCNDGKAPVPGPTHHCDRPAREDITVRAAAGHMHLLGRSIKLEVNPGTPKAQVLLDVPAYNFDDQGARDLPTPVAVKKGDTLRVTCTYDATLRSKLPELKTLKPRYVLWGEGTSDEMCLGVVLYTPGAAAPAP
jgi:hypothetical protein